MKRKIVTLLFGTFLFVAAFGATSISINAGNALWACGGNCQDTSPSGCKYVSCSTYVDENGVTHYTCKYEVCGGPAPEPPGES